MRFLCQKAPREASKTRSVFLSEKRLFLSENHFLCQRRHERPQKHAPCFFIRAEAEAARQDDVRGDAPGIGPHKSFLGWHQRVVPSALGGRNNNKTPQEHTQNAFLGALGSWRDAGEN
jgi:hypothetical protein